MCCLGILSASGYATEQEFFDVAKEEVLEDKYDGYKTTLDERNRGAFSDRSEIYQDVRLYDEDKSSGYLFDFAAGSGSDMGGMTGFRNQFGDNSFEAMSEGFQSEFRSLFTRDDSLIREFSVPQPRYFNQDYAATQQRHNGSGGGYKNPSSYNSGSVNRSNNSGSSSTGSGYDADQPALISWVFSVIAFIRENPLTSGFIALLFLGVLSLIQVIFQRYSRPFGWIIVVRSVFWLTSREKKGYR